MIFVAVHFHAGQDFADVAVDSDRQEPFFSDGFKQFFVVSLTVSHYGSEEEYLFPFVRREDQFDDFLLGIFHHLLAGHVTIGFARSGIE